MHQALVVLADLAIWSVTLLPVHVDFVEVLRLLHKDEPFVRWFIKDIIKRVRMLFITIMTKCLIQSMRKRKTYTITLFGS